MNVLAFAATAFNRAGWFCRNKYDRATCPDAFQGCRSYPSSGRRNSERLRPDVAGAWWFWLAGQAMHVLAMPGLSMPGGVSRAGAGYGIGAVIGAGGAAEPWLWHVVSRDLTGKYRNWSVINNSASRAVWGEKWRDQCCKVRQGAHFRAGAGIFVQFCPVSLYPEQADRSVLSVTCLSCLQSFCQLALMVVTA